MTRYELGSFEWDGQRQTAVSGALAKWKALEAAIRPDDSRPCPLCTIFKRPDSWRPDCAKCPLHDCGTSGTPWQEVRRGIEKMVAALNAIPGDWYEDDSAPDLEQEYDGKMIPCKDRSDEFDFALRAHRTSLQMDGDSYGPDHILEGENRINCDGFTGREDDYDMFLPSEKGSEWKDPVLYKVGDKVRIVCKKESRETPKGVYWNPQMDRTVGEVGTVNGPSYTTGAYSVEVESAGRGWTYPEECLELVEPEKEKPKDAKDGFKVGDRVKVVDTGGSDAAVANGRLGVIEKLGARDAQVVFDGWRGGWSLPDHNRWNVNYEDLQHVSKRGGKRKGAGRPKKVKHFVYHGARSVGDMERICEVCGRRYGNHFGPPEEEATCEPPK